MGDYYQFHYSKYKIWFTRSQYLSEIYPLKVYTFFIFRVSDRTCLRYITSNKPSTVSWQVEAAIAMIVEGVGVVVFKFMECIAKYDKTLTFLLVHLTKSSSTFALILVSKDKSSLPLFFICFCPECIVLSLKIHFQPVGVGLLICIGKWHIKFATINVALLKLLQCTYITALISKTTVK